MVDSLARRSAITFDIDWAPDWAVEECLRLCRESSVTPTFFATHKSPILEDLAKQPNVEVGIHPNFRPGSSQATSSPEDARSVIEFCLSVVPQARSMRTHGLVQSSSLLTMIADEYPQIRTDVSLFLPGYRSVEPVMFYGRRGSLMRIPFYWGDCDSCLDPQWRWSYGPPQTDSLRIFNFHPIHVVLNSCTLEPYEQLKAKLNGRSLSTISPRVLVGLTNSGLGARSFLSNLLRESTYEKFYLISQISSMYDLLSTRLSERHM